ncbi:transmembrane emp24 domain-containing protein 5-like [Saccoglossus kowalevskii]|uniref:Transmembrane emp24 domain-containing protein 6-like n=1 Tax=Saccoglossus kowalevskii TaxID=10224 RepID=A0ABM0GY15_SACKO|nr:PREDICTED: transmembrane emp24 domain-containing protein 6-like [Saccoglossus kowalevskii]
MGSVVQTYIFLVATVVSALAQPDTQPAQGDPLMKTGSRPYVSYDFTIQIRARAEECFHQYTSVGSIINVEYEVLSASSRGRSYDIDFILRGPTGQMMKRISGEEDGSYKVTITREGVYTMCFDNGASKFTAKNVYIEITIIQRGEWRKYIEMQRGEVEAEEDAEEEVETALDTVADSMVDKIETIADLIDDMIFKQVSTRRIAIKDWYLVIQNNSYVQQWSIIQCIVIVAASVFQTFFVRRLFNIKTVTPTQKPRA